MTSRFDVARTSLAGLSIVKRMQRTDERGYLERLYCATHLKDFGFDGTVKQINRTLTRRSGTVRGLHFQREPHAEIKFVSCLRGHVFDVAVDLRPQSSTFLQWHGEELSEQNCVSLLIPEGFAHGFQTLTDDCEMLYLHTHDYTPAAENGISPQDPTLKISWPLVITELSGRDAALPSIRAYLEGASP